MVKPHDPATLEALFQLEAPHRPHWPGDWDTAQRMPLIMALLRTMASHPSAARAVPAKAAPAPRAPRQLHLQAAPTFDGKRAAANDRDDD